MTKLNNGAEVASRYLKMLQASGWHKILRSHLLSDTFRTTINVLGEQVAKDERFVPPLKNAMNPFINCEYDSLKVVFVGADPYNEIQLADGLAFSHPISGSKELPLRVFHKNINDSVYDGKRNVSDFTPELKVWAEQGILLLNSSLTVGINKEGNHAELWKPFMGYLFDMLNASKSNIIYVFFGEQAQFYADLIDEDDNYIFKLGHPSEKGYKWDSQDIFNKINKILSDNHRIEIAW